MKSFDMGPPRIFAWVTTVLAICHTMYAQSGIRPSHELLTEISPTVTLQELQHVVPKQARTEMERGAEARMKNHPEKAIDHLKKAIRIDPEYIAARNNLGVCLLPTEPASAIAQWEEAIRVNPREGILFRNLAVGYAVTQNLDGAERAARTSVELDRTGAQARVMLGLVLFERHKYTVETLALLEGGDNEFPMTHVFAARVLLEQGEFQKARVHLQTYLSGTDTRYRNDAAKLLGFIGRTGQTREPLQNH